MSAPSAINNQREIFVGNTPSTNTITTGDLNSAAFQASTNVGEIGIFSKEGTRLTESSAATATEFVIAVSRGASLPPLVSDVIVKSSLSDVSRKVYAAATEQSLAIGYNGTSGSILDTATFAGEVYTLKMILQQYLSGSDDERIKRGDYKSLTTDGQAEVALGVAKSVNLNMVREVKNSAGDPPVVAKAICNAAVTAANGTKSGQEVIVTKGTDQLLFETDLTYTAAGSSTLVVGDYLRIGSVGGGTALSSSVYQVKSISGLVVTVDRVIIEASGTYDDAGGTSDIEVIPNATGQAANWGIVLTGQPVAFNASKKRYAKVRFSLQPNSAFGSTVVSVLTNASEGVGTYEAVAELENYLQGYKGEQYEMGEPNLFDSSDLRLASASVAGGGYDIITLNHSSNIVNFSTDVAKKEVVLAVPATAPNYAVTGASDDVTDVLEVLAFGSANGNLAMS